MQAPGKNNVSNRRQTDRQKIDRKDRRRIMTNHPRRRQTGPTLEDRSAGITIGQMGVEAGLGKLKAREVIIRII